MAIPASTATSDPGTLPSPFVAYLPSKAVLQEGRKEQRRTRESAVSQSQALLDGQNRLTSTTLRVWEDLPQECQPQRQPWQPCELSRASVLYFVKRPKINQMPTSKTVSTHLGIESKAKMAAVWLLLRHLKRHKRIGRRPSEPTPRQNRRLWAAQHESRHIYPCPRHHFEQ